MATTPEHTLQFDRVRTEAQQGCFDHILDILHKGITHTQAQQGDEMFMIEEFFKLVIFYSRIDVLQMCFKKATHASFMVYTKILKEAVLQENKEAEEVVWNGIFQWKSPSYRYLPSHFYAAFHARDFLLDPRLYAYLQRKIREMKEADTTHPLFSSYSQFLKLYDLYFTEHLDQELTASQIIEWRKHSEAVKFYNENKFNKWMQKRIAYRYSFDNRYEQCIVMDAIKERDRVLRFLPSALKGLVIDNIIEFVVKPYISINLDW